VGFPFQDHSAGMNAFKTFRSHLFDVLKKHLKDI